MSLSSLISMSSVALGEETPQNISPDSLQSPYFIDGVHCEGLSEPDDSIYFFLPDDSVSAVKKASLQEKCERVLKFFGLEKYSWMSQDDLESLSVKIKSSGYFKNVDISVKKSELQNHVHLYAKITQLSERHYSVSNQFSYYGPENKDSSSRTVNTFRGEVLNRADDPTRPFTIGFVASQSITKKPMNYTDPSDPDDPSLNDAEKEQIKDKNTKYLDFYIKNETVFHQNFINKLGVHFYSGHPSKENEEPGKKYASMMMSDDLLYSTSLLGPYGQAHIGPSAQLIMYSVGKEKNSEDKVAFLPGGKLSYIYGNEYQNFWKFGAEYYHAVKGDHIRYHFDLSLGKTFSQLLNTQLAFDMSQDYIAYPLLPDENFFLQKRDLISFGIRAGKTFPLAGNLHHVYLRGGIDSIKSPNGAYGEASSCIGLAYKTTTENYTIDLGAKYYPNRTY